MNHENLWVRLCLCVLGLGLVVTINACDDDDDEQAAPSLYASSFIVVEMDSGAPTPFQLAVQACVGLKNLQLGGSVYLNRESHDQRWLDQLELEPAETIAADAFLESCRAEFPKVVRYSYENQQALLPNILTAAAVLEAIPLDVDMVAADDEIAFDAVTQLQDHNTPYLATKYVFENFAGQTSGLAMLNPGYDTEAEDLANPPLDREMPPHLVDFVFLKKLFVVFLINGCIDGNPEKELLHEIVNAGNWPTPLGVYGYNNSWLKGGYIYEAQTTCLDSRNMGAIPTSTYNLAFFSSRRAPIEDASELAMNPPEDITYDPAKTYVAFVVGDGDNVRFIMTTRREWLEQRLADCEKPDNSCAPLSWSISPHLPELAPDVLEWYYRSSTKTGRDYFILPPSGHHYAYPTSLAESERDKFVAETEADARILGVKGVVHWELYDSWTAAEEEFLPKYAKPDGAIQGVFPVNVPYLFPAFPWWPEDAFFNVLTGEDGGKVVVFKPRQWRGINGRGAFPADIPFFLAPEDMAAEIGNYPRGTVTGIYMTSDGGLNLENSFMKLVKLLPDHVQIVSADTASRLAIESQR